jgi:hypothetical protein
VGVLQQRTTRAFDDHAEMPAVGLRDRVRVEFISRQNMVGYDGVIALAPGPTPVRQNSLSPALAAKAQK